ncbi:RNA polymerase sigma factor [Bacillus phage Anath]|uniref:RNA polymerase sigma factor n=1 Tax=Bacillus phage Anath TaxID=2108114 RepID=A0A2P1JUN5_9CAUD|nr:RNA polymerase sigma factor [Bacillus phage Anath]
MRKPLPDNKVQKLMKEALRGVAPKQHDPATDLFYIIEYQGGDDSAGWKLCEEYLDIFSVIMSKPTQPPKKTKAMQKLWVDVTIQDYEDLFQEILYHFLDLARNFQDHKPFAHAVRAILHQRVFNQHFSEFLEKRRMETEFDDEVRLEYEQKVEDEREAPKVPTQFLHLYQALNTLTKKQRLIIELSVFKGWNSREVAQEIGSNASTVRVTLKNALAKLKKELGGVTNGEEELSEL